MACVTSPFSWLRIGWVLDGRSWVRKTAVTSSTGSTQKAVLAAPPHPNSPLPDSTRFYTLSVTTENPSPNPTPSKVVSANRGRPIDSRSKPPGRWLLAM